MKRTLGSMALIGVLILTSCGSDSTKATQGEASGTCPVDAFKKASGTTKVVVWSTYVGKLADTLNQLAAKYNASQDRVEVTIENQGADYAEALAKFQQAITTKDLPALHIGEDIDTQYMIDSGVILPAQSCIDTDSDPRAKTSDLLAPVKAAYTIDGVQYPASMNVSTIVLYYNREHFRRAGLDPSKPPTTLAEVMADAEKLKAAGVSQEPFVMKQDPWFVEEWITGAKQTLVNNDNGRSGKLATKATLNNDTTKAVFDWLSEMKSKDLLNAVPGTPGQANHYFAMATGNGSMLLETSAAISTIDGVLQGTFDPKDLNLGSEYDSFKGIKIALDLGVAPNPGLKAPGQGKVGGGAWYMTNTGSAAVQSAAWDFMKWFNQPEQQVTWTTDGSYLPILKSVKDNPTLQADWSTTNRGQWMSIAYDAISKVDPKFTGALIGPYAEFRNILRKALESVTLSGGNPDEAVATAQTDETKALEQYAESNF